MQRVEQKTATNYTESLSFSHVYFLRFYAALLD
jgi:hypothetical protein